MKRPIAYRETFTLGDPDGFGLSLRFMTSRDLTAEEGRLGFEFELARPSEKTLPFELEKLSFAGAVQGECRRRGDFQGLYWLGDHQKTLPAQTAPGLGFDCTFKVVR